MASTAKRKVRVPRAAAQRTLRVALVSDTHGFVDPCVLAAVESCDLVVHAGDVGAGAVLAALGSTGAAVHAVRGNNDTPAKWPCREHRTLRGLPHETRLPLPGGVLVVVHGDRVLPPARRHDKLRRLYPDARAVVYGHTHRLTCDRSAMPWILNPGAAGRARTYGGASCLLLDAGTRRWRVRALRFA